MAQVTGQGTSYNLPNYWGELFTADTLKTPILTMIGGLSGGGFQTNSDEFPTAVMYDFPAAAQPALTEQQSLTAPTATAAVRAQVKNVTQLFMQAVQVSYKKLAEAGKMSGITKANVVPSVQDELAFQIDYNLKIVARNVEYTILNGTYNLAAAFDQANKTRGIIEACALSGGTVVYASAATLDKTLMDTFFRTMFNNGAMFENSVLWCGAYQKQQISKIYGYAPEDRNVGGVNIKQLETDFGVIGIGAVHPFMPTTKILCADMAVIKPVTQPVPGKGNFFYEELAKTGGSENGQIYGLFGLDHGPAFAHGVLENLATA